IWQERTPNKQQTPHLSQICVTVRHFHQHFKQKGRTQPMPKEAISKTGPPLPRSIAEKVNSSYFEELPALFLKSEGLSHMVSAIIGDNSTVPSRIPESQASQLAYLLINLRHELNLGKVREVIQTLDDITELCFLHTPVYAAALKVYQLECTGQLVGA